MHLIHHVCACSCTRPGLGVCSEEDFEVDLYGFLAARGEEQLADQLRSKRITWCVREA